jgi:hypothetical protein
LAYDLKAQEFAYSFYVRGYARDRAVREIQKVYAGFSRSTWDEWERKLGWRERRALADAKLREFDELAANTAKVILLSLEDLRKRLVEQIEVAPQLDTQIVYAYNSVCKQISDISIRHLDSRDQTKIAMEVLNQAIEDLVQKLKSIEGLGALLEKYADVVGKAVEEVAETYGREE